MNGSIALNLAAHLIRQGNRACVGSSPGRTLNRRLRRIGIVDRFGNLNAGEPSESRLTVAHRRTISLCRARHIHVIVHANFKSLEIGIPRADGLSIRPLKHVLTRKASHKRDDASISLNRHRIIGPSHSGAQINRLRKT